MSSALGTRIHVIGNSCSGKSSLAAQLARELELPLVELDALNWLPNWVGLNAANPAEFERRIAAATASDRWVVAGSYSGFAQRLFWPRLQSLVWLDLPMPQLVLRMARRTWKRWRTREHLWGTNYERFWPQFQVWRKEESLLWWIVTQHERKRRGMLAVMGDPRWSHIRVMRLTSAREVDAFARALVPR